MSYQSFLGILVCVIFMGGTIAHAKTAIHAKKDLKDSLPVSAVNHAEQNSGEPLAEKNESPAIALDPTEKLPRAFSLGLSLYATGKLEKAYPVLERVFFNEKTLEIHRFHTALILSYAPKTLLTKKTKHFYASYCLRQADDPAYASSMVLTDKQRATLLRIAADGNFDEQNFSRAIHYYGLLAQTKDLRNLAYSEYRLGWIELNQQSPLLAFRRWLQFFKVYGAALIEQDQDLARSMVRDVGRAWTEVNEMQAGVGDLSDEVNSLDIFKTLENDFIEGIVLGLKRYSNPEYVEAFRKQLLKTPHTERIFSQLLQKEIFFKLFPCEVRNWLNPEDEGQKSSEQKSSETEKYLIFLLNSCAKSIVDKQACEKPEGLGIRSTFEKRAFVNSQAVGDFSRADPQILPRISLEIGCQQWDLACRDLLFLALEQSEMKNTRVDADSARALYETCSHGFAQSVLVKPEKKKKSASSEKTEHAPISSQASVKVLEPLRLYFPRLIQGYAKKNLMNPALAQSEGHQAADSKAAQPTPTGATPVEATQEDPIELLMQLALQDSVIQGQLRTFVVENAGIFEKTSLPTLLGEGLSDQEILEVGPKYLKAFAKSPLEPVWFRILEILVRHQVGAEKFSEALALLHQYLPMTDLLPKNETASGLWEFFWLSQGDQVLAVDEASQEKSGSANSTVGSDFDQWVEHLPVSELSEARKTRAFAICFQFNDFETIWENWKSFSKTAVAQPVLLVSFYQKTLEFLKTNELTEEFLKSSDEGQILIRLSKKDPTLTAQILKKGLHTDLSLSSDLQALDRIKVLSQKFRATRLKFNGLFAQNFSAQLKMVQKEEKSVATVEWESAEYGEQAKKMLADDYDVLVSRLEKILTELADKEDMAEVIQQLNDIVAQLKEKQSTLSSAASQGSETQAQPEGVTP